MKLINIARTTMIASYIAYFTLFVLDFGLKVIVPIGLICGTSIIVVIILSKKEYKEGNNETVGKMDN